MKAETDYHEEAKHTERMRGFLGEDPEFRVPRVRQDFTRRRRRRRSERRRRKSERRKGVDKGGKRQKGGGEAAEWDMLQVFPHLSTEKILTTELLRGVAIDKCSELPQEDQGMREGGGSRAEQSRKGGEGRKGEQGRRGREERE